MRHTLLSVFALGPIAMLASASSLRASTATLPNDFVCIISAHNHIDSTGELKKGNERSGGVLAVNRTHGSVAGDTNISSGQDWKVVNTGDEESSAKLMYASGRDFATFVILTTHPSSQSGETTYPFLFMNAGTGEVISGTCRGARS